MKKVIFLLIAVALTGAGFNSAKAQTTVRYFGNVELTPGCDFLVEPSNPYPAWLFCMIGTTHGIEINESLSIGVGIGGGLEYCFPKGDEARANFFYDFYLGADYVFMRGSRFRPYVDARIGMFNRFLPNVMWTAGGGVRIDEHWDVGLMFKQIWNFFDDGEIYNSHHIPMLRFAYRFTAPKKK